METRDPDPRNPDFPVAVSVTMPTYNAGRFLVPALESILVQTFTDFELLILDDGSTDKTPQIIRSWLKRDARIRFWSRENRGAPVTRNELLRKARGEFLAIMDNDDVAAPDRLEKQVRFLQQHPEVVCVGGAYQEIDEQGRHLFHCVEPLTDEEIQQAALRGDIRLHHACSMMRREALLAVGGYLEGGHSDGVLDLWLRLGEVGKLANLPDTLFDYRIRLDSYSCSHQSKFIEEKREACQKAWQRRGVTGHFEATQPWRPVDRSSLQQFILKYGWWMFQQGRRGGAIAYSLRAIKTIPWRVEAWKLLACASLKRRTKATP